MTSTATPTPTRPAARCRLQPGTPPAPDDTTSRRCQPPCAAST
jgi:hypothetical protein